MQAVIFVAKYDKQVVYFAKKNLSLHEMGQWTVKG